MTTISSRRPVAVVVIGLLYVLLAAMMLLGALGFMAVTTTMQARGFRDPGPPGLLLGTVMRFLQSHALAMGTLQVGFAVFLFVSSVAFLRLRAWGRAVLEVATWLGLAYVLAMGGFVATQVVALIGAGAAGGGMLWFTGVFLAFLGLVIAIQAAGCGVLIWFLRSRTVRQAMVQADGRIGE